MLPNRKKAANNTIHMVHHVLQNVPQIVYLTMRDRLLTQLTINATEEMKLQNQTYTLQSVMLYTGNIQEGHWRSLNRENNMYVLYDDDHPPQTLDSSKITSILKKGVDFIYVANTTLCDMPITFFTPEIQSTATTLVAQSVSNVIYFDSPQPSTSTTFISPHNLIQQTINTTDTLFHAGIKRKHSDIIKKSKNTVLPESNNFSIRNAAITPPPTNVTLTPSTDIQHTSIHEIANISNVKNVTLNKLQSYIKKSPFDIAIDKLVTDIPDSNINTYGPWYYHNNIKVFVYYHIHKKNEN